MADRKKPFYDTRVVKRKSYYGFSRQYPGALGDSEYLIGESRTMKRRQNILRIAFAALLVLLFAASFVITYTSLELSNRPIEVPTAVTEETTSVEEIPTSADEG